MLSQPFLLSTILLGFYLLFSIMGYGDTMDLKIFTNNIADNARAQVHTLMEQDAFRNAKVRIMPDVHVGIGSVIGFTGNLGDKVIPNVVGVDIGCGMLTIEIANENLDFLHIDTMIHTFVPSGFKIHRRPQMLPFPLSDLIVFPELKNVDRIEASVGTLGGGNHFIEIGKSADDRYFLVIHTGSRNLGKQVADLYQKKAIAYAKKNQIQIPRDLAYLEGQLKDDYLHDMRLTQKYAQANRARIAEIIIAKCGLRELDRFETVHNYIGDDNIVRKGAISAYKGERVLIPINMRDGSLYGIGLGNPDWNYSGPHGAGRLLSRRQAREQLRLSEFKKDMDGIYTTSVAPGTIDESPRAYKDMQEIIDNLHETIKILFIIKPLYNFKAVGD